MLGKSKSMAKNKLFFPFLALTSYLVLFFLAPKQGHDWDNYCWGLWAEIIQNKGLSAAYNSDSVINYLPLYLYVLKIYALIVPKSSLFEMTYCLKSVSLLFDVVSIYLLTQLVVQENKRWKYFLLGLLNIGFIYNSFVWNQVDGILSFFVFTSILAAHKQKPILALSLFVLAINFKLQGIVFLPILLALLTESLNKQKLIKGALAVIGLQTVILLPFILAGNVWNVWETAKGSMDYYPSISMNAYNFWHFFYDGSLMFVKDSNVFVLGLTHKQIGLTLFLCSSAVVLLPLLIQSIKRLTGKEQALIELKTILLSATLISILFFYFNTQMHERYIHSALIFSTGLAFLYGAWGQWISLSLAYALSLESICKILNLENYNTLVFNPKFISLLYAISLAILVYHWVKTKPLKGGFKGWIR
jgi:Gpi18-like mannosyltransferase